MSIKKQFLKSKPVCKVTFAIDAEQVDNAETVAVLGEFNDWNPEAHPMKKFKNGNFRTTIDLESDKSYQFRYLVDGKVWVNDAEADQFAPAGIAQEENAVIEL